MHPEENRPLSEKPQFGGTVELIPPARAMIQFAGNDRVWAFPIHALRSFTLESNPDNPERKKTLPPDQLTLAYDSAIVVLRGWRLDFMVEPLVCGRIARVQAVDGPMACLMIEEPWVTELHIHGGEKSGSTPPEPSNASEKKS